MRSGSACGSVCRWNNWFVHHKDFWNMCTQIQYFILLVIMSLSVVSQHYILYHFCTFPILCSESFCTAPILHPASVSSLAWMSFNILPWFHVHIKSIGAQLCNNGLMCTYIADAANVSSSQTSLWKCKLEQGSIPRWAAFWRLDKRPYDQRAMHRTSKHF